MKIPQSQSHGTELPSEKCKPVPNADDCTVSEGVAQDTTQTDDTQQTVDKVDDVEVTDSIPAPLPRSVSLQILLPGDISPHGTTPPHAVTPTVTADQTDTIQEPGPGPGGVSVPQETYSLIKEIFGACSRLPV